MKKSTCTKILNLALLVFAISINANAEIKSPSKSPNKNMKSVERKLASVKPRSAKEITASRDANGDLSVVIVGGKGSTAEALYKFMTSAKTRCCAYQHNPEVQLSDLEGKSVSCTVATREEGAFYECRVSMNKQGAILDNTEFDGAE